MSQENVDIVRRSTTLFGEGKWDEMFELYDPEVEFCDLRSAVDTRQVLRGADSMQALLIEWTDAFEEFGVEVYEHIDANPFVICDARWYGKGRESGAAIDVRQADVFEVANGKIVRVTLGYSNKSEAIKAVGLEE